VSAATVKSEASEGRNSLDNVSVVSQPTEATVEKGVNTRHQHQVTTPMHERLEKQYSKRELTELRQIFSMFDTDNSGAIGAVELGEAIKRMTGLQPNGEELDELIAEVDENGDGEINFYEFCHCLSRSRAKQEAGNEETVKLCFDVFDQDGNGVIGEDEFIRVAKEVGGFSHELAKAVFHELDMEGLGFLNKNQFSAIVDDYLFSDLGSRSCE